MLHGITRIGVSAAASTPESIVDGVVGALRRLGRVDVEEVRVAHEDIAFTVPASLRRAAEDS
jgi:4-hydroxy-3-methylbut-2-enyl diphosphate reductase